LNGALPSFLTSPDAGIYQSDNYVVVDFETTNLDKGSALTDANRLLLAVWWTPRQGFRAHFGGVYDQAELLQDINRADFVVAHNAKFELQWLRRCGLALEDTLIWDTMIADYVDGGNRWQLRELSLDACCERHNLGESKGSLVSLMIKAGICPSEIPPDWLLRYCRQDVALTAELFKRQLRTNTQHAIVYTRCLATPVLADIEFNGMQLDGEAVAEMYADRERKYLALEQQLEEFTGGINMNSPKQVSEFLYDELCFDEVRDSRGEPVRTDTGNRSASADTISRLRYTNDRQATFLKLFTEAKELSNELTKYLRKFQDCVTEEDGFLQGAFNQCNTQTHRLSSTGLRYRANFQNFPRAYKRIFKSRNEGWLVGEADGSQLEFRVAAHLGRDETAGDDIRRGVDIHAVTADVIGCSRQEAKADTFKPLYGGKSGTKEQREYYKFFAKKYDGITRTQQRWIDTVLNQKYLETEWGMKYYWPSTRMERSGYVTNSTSICNYPVQAFATAEIIPMALVFFWHRLKRSDLEMLIVNTVHDSIITELPQEEIGDFHELGRQCFLDDVYQYLRNMYDVVFTVPLATGIKVAPRWGVTDEETTFTMEL
jgi:DNA polymerase I-like protein with 3'-5' exonuclease and polymerase domains